MSDEETNEKKESSVECNICGGDIFLGVDNYVVVQDYIEGNFYMEGYYHTPCWHDMAHKQTLEKIRGKTLTLLKKHMNRFKEGEDVNTQKA